MHVWTAISTPTSVVFEATSLCAAHNSRFRATNIMTETKEVDECAKRLAEAKEEYKAAQKARTPGDPASLIRYDEAIQNVVDKLLPGDCEWCALFIVTELALIVSLKIENLESNNAELKRKLKTMHALFILMVVGAAICAHVLGKGKYFAA